MREDAPVLDRLARVFAKSENVVARKIAGECLLVPLARKSANLDAIYELNTIGAFIWERIDGQSVGRAIVDALTERFDVETGEASADYLDFVDALSSIGAIQLVAGARDPSRPASQAGA